MTKQEILNQCIRNFKVKYSVHPCINQEINLPFIKTTLTIGGDKVLSNSFLSINDYDKINEDSIESAILAFESLDLTLVPKK